MISVTGNQMKAIDNYCIEKLGIPGIVLMENAALKVVKNIDLNRFNSFTIVCGVGNNGGDGLAVARHLYVLGKKVKVFIIGNLNKGSEDFNTNYNILNNLGLDLIHVDSQETLETLNSSLKSSDMTIDAIFGTGLSREVEGLYRDVISSINAYSNYILSIDIPSGMNSDTGEILGIAVKADITVTMQLMKKGLVGNSSEAGQVIVEPIGMPKIAIDSVLNIE
jgi:NAD(P)H-hydrate epimerase